MIVQSRPSHFNATVLYALAKSIRLPAAQGRISLRLSGLDPTEPTQLNGSKESPAQPRPRGWWDYVPQSESRSTGERASIQRTQTWNIVDEQGFLRNMRMMFGGWTGDTSTPNSRGKVAGVLSTPQSQPQQRSQRSTVRFSSRPMSEARVSNSLRSPSPCPSRARSLSSLLDRVKPIRELLENEVRSLTRPCLIVPPRSTPSVARSHGSYHFLQCRSNHPRTRWSVRACSGPTRVFH